MSGARSRRLLPATALTALALALLALLLPLTAEAAAPGTPDSVTVTRSNGSLTATWDAVDGATHYHVTYSTDNGTSWHAPVDDHTNIQATSLTFAADNDETYIVGVRAKNGDDGGTWRNSDPAGPYVPQQPPNAVASVAVTRADGSLTASWDAVDGATKHHVTYTTDNGASWSLAALEHPSNSITFDVNNADTYIVGVRAGNDGGWSTVWVNSPASGPYTPPTPEPTPTPAPARGIVVQDSGGNPITALSIPEGGEVSYRVKLTAAPTEDVEVCIGLSVRDNDDSDITFKGEASDVVSLKLTFTPGNWSTAQTVTLVAAEDDADDVNGARDVTHDAREYYSGKVDITATEVDNDEITPPAAPTGLTAIVGGGSVTLSWDDPADASITGYQYRVNHNDTSTGKFSGWGDWQTITDGAAVSHTLDGLTNGREYRFKIRAVNAAGAGAIAPAADPWFIAASPLAPAAPSNFTVTSGDGYFDLDWDAVSGATAYDVRAKVANSNSWTSVATGVTATSYRYTTSDVVNVLAVRGQNAGGAGPWAELSRMPSNDWLNVVIQGGASGQSAQGQSQLAAPASLTVTRRNHTRDEKLYVTWAAVSGAGGYNLACANTPVVSNTPYSDVSWWRCGSVDSGSTTTFTVDEDKRGGITRDLGYNRSYAVAVRAVTADPAEASPWLLSADAHPALVPDGTTMSVSRNAGSVSFSWARPQHAQGYEIQCATRENNVTGAYTLCADVETATVANGRINVTISSWTAGGNNYTIDDTKTYDLKVKTTNAWGDSPYHFAPLIHPSMVSNLASTKSGDSSINSGLKQAVAFTTGSNTGGYVLKSITVPLKRVNSRASNLTLKLHAMEGSGQYSSTSEPSDTVLATLSGTAPTAATWTDTTYTCSGSGCDLSPDTTYFVVAAASDSSPAYAWAYARTETETALPSDNGWDVEFGHYRNSLGSRWGSWSDWNIAEIVFATNPSLDASNIGTHGATLTIANHGGVAWYYKHTNTGATCDGPVAAGTSTKALTNLTTGTSYTYSAYSDSTCTTGNLLATAAQFIPSGSVSNLSAASDGFGVGVQSGLTAATGFTTGQNDATLWSVTIKFKAVSAQAADSLTVAVHADSGGNPAASATHALTGSDPTGAGEYTYTCSGGCSLSKGRTYFLVLKGSASTSLGRDFTWDTTSSASETNTPSSGFGWSIADKGREHNGSSWSEGFWTGIFKVEASAY